MNEHLQNGALKGQIIKSHRNVVISPDIVKNISYIKKKFDNIKKPKIYETLMKIKKNR